MGGNPESVVAPQQLEAAPPPQAPSGSGQQGWRRGRGRRGRKAKAARSVPVKRRGHR